MNLKLYEQKSPHLEIDIHIEIAASGDLKLSGVESGELVKRIEGDWDYEYFITVKKKDKETLKKKVSTPKNKIRTDQELLDWIAQNYKIRDAFVKVKALLKALRIPFKDFDWV